MIVVVESDFRRRNPPARKTNFEGPEFDNLIPRNKNLKGSLDLVDVCWDWRMPTVVGTVMLVVMTVAISMAVTDRDRSTKNVAGVQQTFASNGPRIAVATGGDAVARGG